VRQPLVALIFAVLGAGCSSEPESENETEERVLMIIEVRRTDSTGDDAAGFSSARIVQPGDVLPVTGTAEADILIASTMGRTPPSGIDSFRLATGAGSKCTVTDPGRCVGTTCGGAFQLNAWGVCVIGFLVETPEADGVVCWEHSIVDSISVGDAAYHAEADAAYEACRALRSEL
jgi:hypothetical protein